MTKKYNQREKKECMAFMQLLFYKNRMVYKEIIKIEPGGYRDKREAINLGKMGIKGGIADYFLPISNKASHGLWLEFKIGKNELTELQNDFKIRVTMRGYDYKIAYTSNEAVDIITKYLSNK